MSDDSQGDAKAPALGGISGDHPDSGPLEYLVAPTNADDFNTARLRLIPIACWRVDDVRFRFDSSFPLFDSSSDPASPNDIRGELKSLADLVKAHPGAPLSVFGHADPVGNDDYNKVLSGRRATAIYALLVRDTSLWNKIYQSPFGGDNWQTDVHDTMLQATGLPKGTQNPALFKSYMDLLCGADFQLQKADFLAQGADSEGKGDYQGCSEFNPLLIFSKERQTAFDQAAKKKDKEGVMERDAANAPNRRVMILFFRKGSKIDPAKWPCPRATEGSGGCKKRFFSDGEKRRGTHDSGVDRTFEQSEDTFACRFYQRISSGSPCHALLDNSVVTEIQATVVSTQSLHDDTKIGVDKVFKSKSDQESLADNEPTVLIRGCLDVQLQAITTPANLPVSWLVKPNENDETAPAIAVSDGGRRASLKTDKAGSFAVVALLGVTKIVWNVVFAWVKVDPASSAVKTNDAYFRDDGSSEEETQFGSGDEHKGEHVWQATVDLEVFGGGKEKKLGVRKVDIHTLQNCTIDTLTGHYKGGGTGREVPKGPMPITDATAHGSPYCTFPDTVTPPNASATDNSKDRHVFTGDSPGGSFVGSHPKTNKRLVSISGGNTFVTAIVSTTDDAPDQIVVHAKAGWMADYSGTVDGDGNYTPKGAGVKNVDLKFQLVSPDTGGQEARAAKFQSTVPHFTDPDGWSYDFEPK